MSGLTRSEFLVCCGAAALALPRRPGALSVDLALIRTALGLERVQLSLHDAILARTGVPADLREFAGSARAHADAHVQALRRTASAPVSMPAVPRITVCDVGATAVLLADEVAAAYSGMFAHARDAAVRELIVAIGMVEARDAARVRAVVARPPIADAFDEPIFDAAGLLRRLPRLLAQTRPPAADG